jgi:hypothetical protein
MLDEDHAYTVNLDEHQSWYVLWICLEVSGVFSRPFSGFSHGFTWCIRPFIYIVSLPMHTCSWSGFHWIIPQKKDSIGLAAAMRGACFDLVRQMGQCSCSNYCSVPVIQKRKGSLDQEQILQLFGPLAVPKRIDASTWLFSRVNLAELYICFVEWLLVHSSGWNSLILTVTFPQVTHPYTVLEMANRTLLLHIQPYGMRYPARGL